MAGKMCCDDDMMYCAGILLELPQLVYLSEFKEAWKQGNWNSTKKRSARKTRRHFVDFNSRFGSSSSASECCRSFVKNNKSQKERADGDVAGKKRKRMKLNPNLGPTTEIKKPKQTPPRTTTTITTTLLRVKFKLNSSPSNEEFELPNVGGGDGTVVVGKRRKKKTREAELPPPAKKHKSSLNVAFEFRGCAGQKDSSINYFEKTEQTEATSDVVKVVSPDSSSSADKKKKGNNEDDDDDMTKPVIPDLNIPLNTIEDDHLPNPTKSIPLLLATATAAPRPHCFTIHNYRASMDRAAAAKEKRMMRMMKLKQRKMAS